MDKLFRCISSLFHPPPLSLSLLIALILYPSLITFHFPPSFSFCWLFSFFLFFHASVFLFFLYLEFLFLVFAFGYLLTCRTLATIFGKTSATHSLAISLNERNKNPKLSASHTISAQHIVLPNKFSCYLLYLLIKKKELYSPAEQEIGLLNLGKKKIINKKVLRFSDMMPVYVQEVFMNIPIQVYMYKKCKLI